MNDKLYDILRAILIGGIGTTIMVATVLLLVAAMNMFPVYAVMAVILLVVLSGLAYTVKL